MPDRTPWPGEQSPVLVRKNFAHGWVQVKTTENQTAWINLNHAMQVYLLADQKAGPRAGSP
jgi:hypothetical protein